MTMALDIKTISCPGCGSTDIAMVSETQGICNMCGAQFSVQQKIETQNVYNVPESATQKIEVLPHYEGRYAVKYNKKQFLREAILTLAKEDAPLEALENDLSEVREIEHTVFCSEIDFNVSYTASIGYNKPYGTEWVPMSGEIKITSTVFEDENKYFDNDLFRESLILSSDLPSLEGVPETKIREITENNHFDATTVVPLHALQVRSKLERSLPGDCVRDLHYNSEPILSKASLITVPEYTTSVRIGQEDKTIRAFPVGTMPIYCGYIEDSESVKARTDEMEKQIEEHKDSIEKNIWIKAKKSFYLTFICSAISMLVSLLVRSYIVAILVFIPAVVAFILNLRTEKDAKMNEESAIKTEESNMKSFIENYTLERKNKKKTLIEEKFNQLGLDPLNQNDIEQYKI